MSTDAHVKQRLDDILDLLPRYHGNVSRARLLRAIVFALPLEDAEHVSLILAHGRFREREALGLPISDEALEEVIGDLGWYGEDAERAALVTELDRLRSATRLCAYDLRKALDHLGEVSA